MFEKFTKKMVRNAGRAIKEEAAESMDEVIPILFGVASVALMIFANIQSPKPVAQAITINNYYFGR